MEYYSALQKKKERKENPAVCDMMDEPGGQYTNVK